MQGDPVGGITVADDAVTAVHGHVEAGFLAELAGNGLFRAFARLHPAAGEFPEIAPDPGGQALLHENPARVAQHAGDHLNGRDRGPFAGYRALVHNAQMQADAEGGQGAERAARLFAADQRAQLHHGLVVLAGPAFGH